MMDLQLFLENTELFQRMIIPPEAPTEGAKEKLSNCLGQHFLMKEKSKSCFFVSWIQAIAQPHSTILL
jgi:hypothetical protein